MSRFMVPAFTACRAPWARHHFPCVTAQTFELPTSNVGGRHGRRCQWFRGSRRWSSGVSLASLGIEGECEFVTRCS